jgi:hypothetical protein
MNQSGQPDLTPSRQVARWKSSTFAFYSL